MTEAIHVHYNPKINQMVSVQYRSDLELYEVQRYCDLGRLYIAVMSMDRIMSDSKNEVWEFLGVL
jgi:hypothetical protein